MEAVDLADAERPMFQDSARLLRAVLQGGLTRAEVEGEAERRWRTWDFVVHGDPRLLPPWPPSRRAAERYGFHGELTTQVLYGAAGEPGCLRIWTPEGGPWDRGLARLRVPLHTHDSGHLTVLTAGAATFLCVREVEGRPTVVEAPMAAGDAVFYPAGVPHTFASDQAFEVASLQAAYREPEAREFAQDAAGAWGALPRCTYSEARASVPAP